MKSKNLKKTQLESLIRGIVNELLNEYEASMSMSDVKQMMNNNPSLDPSIPPQDAMTPAEKSRIEREAEKDRKTQLKTKETELKTAKKQMDYQKQQVDQATRFTIPTLNTDLKNLKTGQI